MTNHYWKKKFIGLVYTGHQNEDTIFKTINFYKNTKNTAIELLVHPGFTDKKERILFKKNTLNFIVILIENKNMNYVFPIK